MGYTHSFTTLPLPHYTPTLYHTHITLHSMHLLPQPFTEKGQFYKHAADSDFHIGYGMVDRPNPNDVGFIYTFMP